MLVHPPLPRLRVDHVTALKEGDADEPWQTGKDAKAEDGWEKQCSGEELLRQRRCHEEKKSSRSSRSGFSARGEISLDTVGGRGVTAVSWAPASP